MVSTSRTMAGISSNPLPRRTPAAFARDDGVALAVGADDDGPDDADRANGGSELDRGIPDQTACAAAPCWDRSGRLESSDPVFPSPPPFRRRERPFHVPDRFYLRHFVLRSPFHFKNSPQGSYRPKNRPIAIIDIDGCPKLGASPDAFRGMMWG